MKSIILIFIVSITSFFVTRNDIFPAYLISIPLTIYLAQRIYCNFSDTPVEMQLNPFHPLYFIGVLILVQTYLPQTLSFQTLTITESNLPVALNVALGILTYVSFIALCLVVYCENGKLNLKLLLEDTGRGEGGFLYVIFRILLINPMIILIFSFLIGGMLFIVIDFLS